MLVSIRPASDIFVAVFAEHPDLLIDSRPGDFAIGSRRYRDKPGLAFCALYGRGYE